MKIKRKILRDLVRGSVKLAETFGGMDADGEHTGMYLQRVSAGFALRKRTRSRKIFRFFFVDGGSK